MIEPTRSFILELVQEACFPTPYECDTRLTRVNAAAVTAAAAAAVPDAQHAAVFVHTCVWVLGQELGLPHAVQGEPQTKFIIGARALLSN